MIESFKVLQYICDAKITFPLFPSLWLEDFKPEKFMVFFFSEILIRTTVGLIEKRVLFPGKILVCGWN